MILVVDDHQDSQYALVRMLKLEGYGAVAASSGDDALVYLEANKPSLIVLDYHMPGIDGLTLFRHLRADVRLRDVPVLMFSAADYPLKDRALSAGVDAFVLKGSLDWTELRREIHRLAGAPGKPPSIPVIELPRNQQVV